MSLDAVAPAPGDARKQLETIEGSGLTVKVIYRRIFFVSAYADLINGVLTHFA